MRIGPTAPVRASTYQGPVRPTMTREPGGRIAADAEAKVRVSPGMRPGFAVSGHTRPGAIPGKPQISWVFAVASADKAPKN